MSEFRAPSMGFHVVTVFPDMVDQALKFGVVSQAIKSGYLAVTTVSPRLFTSDVHQTVDDRPFGGGDGMIMKPEPLAAAIEFIRKRISSDRRVRVIHLSPRGVQFTDNKARELATNFDDLILVSSRYGGVDQRFINSMVDEEISIGDYILSGGELAALVVVDSVARLTANVLGNEKSSLNESFGPEIGGLEFPQFTRPRQWNEQEVPAVLLGGNHAKIQNWQKMLSVYVTAKSRPDLLGQFEGYELSDALAYFSTFSEQEPQISGFSLDDLALMKQRLNLAIERGTKG